MTEQAPKDRKRVAIVDFGRMLRPQYSLEEVEKFAQNIRSLVASGELTWEELSFTDEEVSERLEKARQKST